MRPWTSPKYWNNSLLERKVSKYPEGKGRGLTSTYIHCRILNELEVQNKFCSCDPSQRAVELQKVFPLLSFLQFVMSWITHTTYAQRKGGMTNIFASTLWWTWTKIGTYCNHTAWNGGKELMSQRNCWKLGLTSHLQSMQICIWHVSSWAYSIGKHLTYLFHS